jgi:hypothetical protein
MKITRVWVEGTEGGPPLPAIPDPHPPPPAHAPSGLPGRSGGAPTWLPADLPGRCGHMLTWSPLPSSAAIRAKPLPPGDAGMRSRRRRRSERPCRLVLGRLSGVARPTALQRNKPRLRACCMLVNGHCRCWRYLAEDAQKKVHGITSGRLRSYSLRPLREPFFTRSEESPAFVRSRPMAGLLLIAAVSRKARGSIAEPVARISYQHIRRPENTGQAWASAVP